MPDFPQPLGHEIRCVVCFVASHGYLLDPASSAEVFPDAIFAAPIQTPWHLERSRLPFVHDTVCTGPFHSCSFGPLNWFDQKMVRLRPVSSSNSGQLFSTCSGRTCSKLITCLSSLG